MGRRQKPEKTNEAQEKEDGLEFFTGRKAELQRIEEVYDDLEKEISNYFKKKKSSRQKASVGYRALSFYGKGGIGKTELKSKISSEYSSKHPCINLDLSLIDIDVINFMRELYTKLAERYNDDLKDFRKKFKELTNENLPDPERIRYIKKIADVGSDMIKNIVPIESIAVNGLDLGLHLGYEIFSKLVKKVKKDNHNDTLQSYQKLLVETTDKLADCIFEIIKKDDQRPLIIFLDSFDKNLIYNKDINPIYPFGEWLNLLISKSRGVLWIITGRDDISDNITDEGLEYLELSELTNFSEDESSEYLEKRRMPPEFSGELYKKSKGYPLHLQIFADMYENDNTLTPQDFPDTPDKIIKRQLQNMTVEQKYYVKVMACLQKWDYAMFDTVLNYSSNPEIYDIVVNTTSYIKPDGPSHYHFDIDDAKFIFEDFYGGSYKFKAKTILKSAVEYLDRREKEEYEKREDFVDKRMDLAERKIRCGLRCFQDDRDEARRWFLSMLDHQYSLLSDSWLSTLNDKSRIQHLGYACSLINMFSELFDGSVSQDKSSSESNSTGRELSEPEKKYHKYHNNLQNAIYGYIDSISFGQNQHMGNLWDAEETMRKIPGVPIKFLLQIQLQNAKEMHDQPEQQIDALDNLLEQIEKADDKKSLCWLKTEALYYLLRTHYYRINIGTNDYSEAIEAAESLFRQLCDYPETLPCAYVDGIGGMDEIVHGIRMADSLKSFYFKLMRSQEEKYYTAEKTEDQRRWLLRMLESGLKAEAAEETLKITNMLIENWQRDYIEIMSCMQILILEEFKAVCKKLGIRFDKGTYNDIISKDFTRMISIDYALNPEGGYSCEDENFPIVVVNEQFAKLIRVGLKEDEPKRYNIISAAVDSALSETYEKPSYVTDSYRFMLLDRYVRAGSKQQALAMVSLLFPDEQRDCLEIMSCMKTWTYKTYCSVCEKVGISRNNDILDKTSFPPFLNALFTNTSDMDEDGNPDLTDSMHFQSKVLADMICENLQNTEPEKYRRITDAIKSCADNQSL